jgi:hypothetical protein
MTPIVCDTPKIMQYMRCFPLQKILKSAEKFNLPSLLLRVSLLGALLFTSQIFFTFI